MGGVNFGSHLRDIIYDWFLNTNVRFNGLSHRLLFTLVQGEQALVLKVKNIFKHSKAKPLLCIWTSFGVQAAAKIWSKYTTNPPLHFRTKKKKL